MLFKDLTESPWYDLKRRNEVMIKFGDIWLVAAWCYGIHLFVEYSVAFHVTWQVPVLYVCWRWWHMTSICVPRFRFTSPSRANLWCHFWGFAWKLSILYLVIVESLWGEGVVLLDPKSVLAPPYFSQTFFFNLRGHFELGGWMVINETLAPGSESTRFGQGFAHER
jgi:hypothetical protein